MSTINQDISVLGKALGTVLREQRGERFYQLVEQVRIRTRDLREQDHDTAEIQELLVNVSLEDAEGLVRAFSTWFQLANLAEEEERVRRVAAQPRPRKQSIEDAVKKLSEQGLDAEQVEALCTKVTLGLTFTAHPTEMRRRTVRQHLDAIAREIPGILNPDALERITAHIEALWNTLELRHVRPTVRDEVKGGLHYIDVIAQVLPGLERDLRLAFEQVFGQKRTVRLPIELHSWMGGDRDGNPNVTAEATTDTFALHAERAKEMLLAGIAHSFGQLSQHVSRLNDPPTMPDVMPQGLRVDEPWRALLGGLHRTVTTGAATANTPLTALSAVEQSLRTSGQSRSAESFVHPLCVQASIMGLHLVSLDVREHSEMTGLAVADLLTHVGIESYASLTEHEKQTILVRELATRRPLLAVGETPSARVEQVVGPMRAARSAMLQHGPRAFGRYIVSMSEAVSDLLEVLILAREAGVRALPVPLFETLPDLARAPDVMRDVLALPVYRDALGADTQEIMIGYSDSNKDGGFFAASWALHEAQCRIAAVCSEARVPWRFFHGRGTSIGRGGGPVARGILGQPGGTLGTGLRITEQGEALADKYRHPALAHRSLEQGIYGLLLAAAVEKTDVPTEFSQAMHAGAAASLRVYRGLIEDPQFISFFEAVTPIREIARLNIASRPVRRPGPSSLHNLRAIPWVMSWTQNRANIPGWFGLHAALNAMPEALCREMYTRWGFFRSVIDNAQTSLATSDITIFRAYLCLAPAGHPIGEAILRAHTEAVARVTAITGGELLAEEPRLARSIRLRNPYVDPIHRLQVELLRRVRSAGETTVIDPALERALLLSIHGIAAGVRNTG